MVHADAMLLTVTENGYGKRTPFGEYRTQKRGGKGMIANELTAKTGDLVTALGVRGTDAIMIVTKMGTMIRMPVDGVRVTGRSAQGVKLIDLEDDDVVMSATPVEPEDEEAPAPSAEGAAPENRAENPEREMP